MPKVYVVSEYGWDYDDNNYYRSDSSGSHPTVAYSTLEKANKECDKKNLERFKSEFNSQELSNYYSEFSNLVRYDPEDSEKTDKVFAKIFGCTASHWYHNPKSEMLIKPTAKEWTELYDCFWVTWYQVVEVNLKD
jgi:hypothetical protein